MILLLWFMYLNSKLGFKAFELRDTEPRYIASPNRAPSVASLIEPYIETLIVASSFFSTHVEILRVSSSNPYSLNPKP